jgi:hypothetical protein
VGDIFIYSPLSLYAVNKEASLVSRKDPSVELEEMSVTDDHWSAREKVEVE